MKNTLKVIFNRIASDIKAYWKAIAAFIIYYLLMLHFFNASCPMVILFGLPCPGCGLTRALFCVFTLRWGNAFYLNPISFLIGIFLIVFFIFRYIYGKLPKWLIAFFWIIVVLLFIRYLYGLFNWFPNRIPYVYRRKNLFTHLLKYIR